MFDATTNIRRDIRRKGVVIEFKKASRTETLEEAATAAMEQIERNHYASELRSRGVGDTVKLGIAFHGKQISIRSGG